MYGEIRRDSLRYIQPEVRGGGDNFRFLVLGKVYSSSGTVLGPGEAVMDRAAQAPTMWM